MKTAAEVWDKLTQEKKKIILKSIFLATALKIDKTLLKTPFADLPAQVRYPLAQLNWDDESRTLSKRTL